MKFFVWIFIFLFNWRLKIYLLWIRDFVLNFLICFKAHKVTTKRFDHEAQNYNIDGINKCVEHVKTIQEIIHNFEKTTKQSPWHGWSCKKMFLWVLKLRVLYFVKKSTWIKKKYIVAKPHKSLTTTKCLNYLCFTPFISNIDSSGYIIIIYWQA